LSGFLRERCGVERVGGEVLMGFEQVLNIMALPKMEVSLGEICGCMFWRPEVLKVLKVFLHGGVGRGR
jgi:hypothetical protein